MTVKHISLGSPIEEKIAWAERVYCKAGSRLSGDPEISSLIKRFEAAAGASHRMMQKTGIVEICRECDQHEGGSCCGKGIEDRYSGVMLLINLLLERPLPHRRYDPAGCFFLGPSGCVLAARHVICINYLCNRVTDSVSSEHLSCLRDSEGEEVHVLFLLAERVKRELISC
ncbi:MAG: hypothetical protein ACQET7_02085 [Thermodesulfobacteriota bacterium]